MKFIKMQKQEMKQTLLRLSNNKKRLTKKQKTNNFFTTYCVLSKENSLYVVVKSKWADLIGQSLLFYIP